MLILQSTNLWYLVWHDGKYKKQQGQKHRHFAFQNLDLEPWILDLDQWILDLDQGILDFDPLIFYLDLWSWSLDLSNEWTR